MSLEEWVDLLLLATICDDKKFDQQEACNSKFSQVPGKQGFLGPSEQWCNNNHRAIVAGVLYGETP